MGRIYQPSVSQSPNLDFSGRGGSIEVIGKRGDRAHHRQNGHREGHHGVGPVPEGMHRRCSGLYSSFFAAPCPDQGRRSWFSGEGFGLGFCRRGWERWREFRCSFHVAWNDWASLRATRSTHHSWITRIPKLTYQSRGTVNDQ